MKLNDKLNSSFEEYQLEPNKPMKMILGDNPIYLLTNQNVPLIEIFIDKKGDLVLKSSQNGEVLRVALSDEIIIGNNNVFKHFWYKDLAKFVSRNHVSIKIEQINGDGSFDLSVMDLVSTNGTKLRLETSDVLSKKISYENILAGGEEGNLMADSGDARAKTIRGLRENNEDGILVRSGLIALADGVGGESFGELASESALRSVAKLGNTAFSKEYFEQVCEDLGDMDLGPGGTTLAVARKFPSEKPGRTMLELAHVGDSKIIVVKFAKNSDSGQLGKIIWESIDQSVVQEYYKNGVLVDPIERYLHFEKNKIINVIDGKGLRMEPEIEQLEVPVGGGMVILCSDGVTDFVSPEEILKSACLYNQLCVENIIDLALSRQNREFDVCLNGRMRHIDTISSDNISVAVMMF